MKNKYSFLLLFAAFCCLGVQCKEDDDSYAKELAKLPPYTKKGYNTFGCLINGKAFPQSSEGYHRRLMYFYGGELHINYQTLFNDFDINESITIKTNKISSVGEYYILPVVGEDQFSVKFQDESYGSIYPSNTGVFVYIGIDRLDTINQIVSGRFSFTLNDLSGAKKVTVEHGRFDYQYQ